VPTVVSTLAISCVFTSVKGERKPLLLGSFVLRSRGLDPPRAASMQEDRLAHE
jgi:hypothetical protein